LADAADAVAVRLGHGGLWTAALTPAEEAVDLRRRMADEDPAGLLELTVALSDLGVRYSELGRRTDAVVPVDEAVRILRHLASGADDYRISLALALALNTQGTLFKSIGRIADAVRIQVEAVRLLRELTAADPDRLPLLGLALMNLGVTYFDSRRLSDALRLTEEAVDCFRQADLHLSSDSLPNLAGALFNLGTFYAGVGRVPEALQVTEDAVDLWRKLADYRPGNRGGLASALVALGERLAESGRPDVAVVRALDAVVVLSEVVDPSPRGALLHWATPGDLDRKISRQPAYETVGRTYQSARFTVQGSYDKALYRKISRQDHRVRLNATVPNGSVRPR
jgi:tetratricopeptide (TPR) repeat protein